MRNDISNRLNRVLSIDKSLEPRRILPALRSDIRDVLREYGELKSDITLEIQDFDDGYNVVMLANIIRFKG